MSAPQAPQLPQPWVVDVSAVPRTGQEVQALRIRINDLKDELQNAAERRNTVAEHLKNADVRARPGYEARLQALDTRILGIEGQLTAAVSQLSAATPGALLQAGSQEERAMQIAERISGDIVPIVAILSVFVLGPFAIAISRFFWRRGSAPPRVVADQGTLNRLEQLQQSMDAIAVEVERISEGQRFVTRMMNDRAIGAGAAEPIRAPQRSAIPSERQP